MNWQITQLVQGTFVMVYNDRYLSSGNRKPKSVSQEPLMNQLESSEQHMEMEERSRSTIVNTPVLFWANLTVTIPVTKDGDTKGIYKEKRVLLDSISGRMDAGNLIALMGPSGAGKSTLLSLLSQRVRCESSGTVLLHGKSLLPQSARRIIGFVPQQDIAFESLTAREHLSFMAELRLGSGWRNTGQWTKRVDELLQDLNLSDSCEVRIENLSGGERKRLALAVELLTRPIVLLCDEPCSGLDSSSALHIVQLLKKEAGRGATVMCSMHQPANKLLGCFDRVLVLGHKGKNNLVEFAVKDGGKFGKTGDEDKSGNQDNVQTEICTVTSNHFGNSKVLPTEISCSPSEKLQHTDRLPWLRQMYLLLSRNYTTAHRRPWTARFATPFLAVLTGSFIALFYSAPKPDPPNQEVIQNLRGVLYLISSEVMFTSAYSALGRLPGQLALLRRERGLYSISAAYAADVINLVPKAVIEPLLLLGCAFWFIQLESLRTIGCFSAVALVLIYVSLVANAYGCLLFGLLGSASLASEVAAPLDLLLLLLSGMFIALPSLPSVLNGMRYLSAFYYCNDALATMHWAQVSNITCPTDQDLPCLRDGREVLHRWGFTEPPAGWVLGPTGMLGLFELVLTDLGGLLALGIVMHFGAYLGLRRQANKEAAY